MVPADDRGCHETLFIESTPGNSLCSEKQKGECHGFCAIPLYRLRPQQKIDDCCDYKNDGYGKQKFFNIHPLPGFML